MTMVRDIIRLPCMTSQTRSFTRSQPRSLLSMARLNNASSRTRFSIDFRTVHVSDLRGGRGAVNVDSACTGSSIRDFVCAADLSPMPADVVELFVDGTEDRGTLVYENRAAAAV